MQCIDCSKEVSLLETFRGRCRQCHALKAKSETTGKSVEELRSETVKEPDRQLDEEIVAIQKGQRARNVILTTDPAHNLPVSKHIEVVSAEVVVGMNILKDFLTGVRNIVGGRTGNVQKALRDIRIQALSELRLEAAELGADAVVGVTLAYNEIGATGSTMLMLVATGTAVQLDQNMEQPN